ncbi:hypothetical protein [Kaistia granuli]|uniref:hypothetical protein n=1 Tax=Kaistia granuli TaxID=363259 RepID=UPI00037F6CFD|nr:hypothetical protein [Kaistia granuli]
MADELAVYDGRDFIGSARGRVLTTWWRMTLAWTGCAFPDQAAMRQIASGSFRAVASKNGCAIRQRMAHFK